MLGGWTILVRENPERTHRARLRSKSSIDRNYRLSVDGAQVYASPDFSPGNFDYREQLVWDVSGRVVVFVVAERRVFGYDAEAKRPLTADELERVEFHGFEEVGYGGDGNPPPLAPLGSLAPAASGARDEP